jgi:hypothetical protein
MGDSNSDGYGGGVDGDGSGGNSPSRQGVGTETYVPRNSSLMVAVLRNFSWTDARLLRVFASKRTYRRKGDVRGWTRGPRHLVVRLGGPAPPHGVASRWPSSVFALDFVFVSGKIGGLAFVSSNSENISCVTFLKHKNSRKQKLADEG